MNGLFDGISSVSSIFSDYPARRQVPFEGVSALSQSNSNENLNPESFVYPIGSEAPVVNPLPAQFVPVKQISPGRTDKLLLNSDGSLPENSPLRYLFQAMGNAEQHVKSYLRDDGFYKNLIFAEGLFEPKNDEVAINNAVVNVNIFMKPNNDNFVLPSQNRRFLMNQRIDPKKVEITINHDYSGDESATKTATDWTRMNEDGNYEFFRDDNGRIAYQKD